MEPDQLYHLIMQAADDKLSTSAEAKAIAAAGLDLQLRSVIRQIAGLASRPIVHRDDRD